MNFNANLYRRIDIANSDMLKNHVFSAISLFLRLGGKIPVAIALFNHRPTSQPDGLHNSKKSCNFALAFRGAFVSAKKPCGK